MERLISVLVVLVVLLGTVLKPMDLMDKLLDLVAEEARLTCLTQRLTEAMGQEALCLFASSFYEDTDKNSHDTFR